MRLGLIFVAATLAAQPPSDESLAPFLPAPQIIVDRMLESARLKPGEVVYDLGAGDGRILITAAQKYRARAIGVELMESLFRNTVRRITSLGLDTQVKMIHGNAMNVDLSPADVVTVFLLTSSNERLKPNFEKYLKPGARVVSYAFEIPGWEAARVETVQLEGRVHNIYVYEIQSKKKK
ncbi:MAG: SAM-dependent methyltransferase [Bryobacteraceae bacterium]